MLKTPFSFDGHGVNDAEGQRLAKISDCGITQMYLGQRQDGTFMRNPDYDKLGKLLAAAPELLKSLKECIARLEAINDAGEATKRDKVVLGDALAIVRKVEGGE